MQNDIIINSFYDIDIYSNIVMPIITVCYNTTDYPSKYTARLFNLDKPTNIITIADTLDEIRNKIPYTLNRLMRDTNDDVVIVESYI